MIPLDSSKDFTYLYSVIITTDENDLIRFIDFVYMFDLIYTLANILVQDVFALQLIFLIDLIGMKSY